jgi:serine/threonine protein kinase
LTDPAQDPTGAGPESLAGEEEEAGTSATDPADPLDALLAQLADAPEQEVDSSPPRRLEPGSRVARYEVVRELGRGGFGVVYEARDVELGRHVALKALRPDRLGRRGKRGEKQRALRLSLLQQEAEMVAKLQHPNIVTLYDLVLHEGLPYLVLELLSGETLHAALARGPVPPGEALEIGVQIARGLTHAHAAGVIHRDLKPSNVFRTHDGLVKLLDLGLARGLAGAALLPRAGTPGFMAPEQWRGAEDERSDIYGAGLLLHALLGGKLPHAFSGTGSLPRSEMEATKRKSSQEPQGPLPPLEIPRSAPPELASLIQRSVSADPAHRPQSARALLDELLAFQRASPLSPLLDNSLAGPAPATPISPTQRRSVRVGLIILILFMLSLLPWLATRHSSQPLQDGLRSVHPSATVPMEAETFRDTGPLLSARDDASVLLLRNGLVLVAGGEDESGASTAAELFDPVAQNGLGAFRLTGPLSVARHGATATLLGDGRALIAGGEGHNGTLDALELFEPSGNRGRGAFWTGPILHTARSGHCAVALGDGRVLLAGGEKDGKPLGDAELFDPRMASPDGERGTLLAPVAMTTTRSHPSCALLPDGRALIAGGVTSSGAVLASAELFDPDAGEGRGAFVLTGNLATGRAFAAPILLEDGRIFLAGGIGAGRDPTRGPGIAASLRALQSVERFEPLANAGKGGFVPAPPLLSPRRAGAAIALPSGAVLFAGGTGDNDNRLASAELYAPDAATPARATVNLSTPRGSPAAALLADGRVLIAGGDQRPGRPISSAELFFPRASGRPATSVSAGPMHTARAFANTLRFPDGSVLIAGGRAGSALDSIERFDLKANAFTEVGKLHVARTSAAAVSLHDGAILIAGGIDAAGAPVSSAELITLQPGQIKSAQTASLATPRAFAGAVLLPDGRALIAGGAGSESDGTVLASAELFDPQSHTRGYRGAFLPTGAMGTARTEPLISLLPDGRVLIAGGLSQNGLALASAEIFDPLAEHGRGAFVPTGAMAQGRTRAAVALLPTGKVLIAGGLGEAALASAELFDPLADNGRGAFLPTGGLAVSRSRAGIAILPDGNALIIGGTDSDNGALASTEQFEPQAEDGVGSFAPAAGLSIGRELPLCARLPGGGVLIAGGRNNGVLASAEIWKRE